MAETERLSGWDYATWTSSHDDPLLRSTMVGVMVLEESPDWARLVDRYERATRLVPILRKKVIEGPVGFANPRLIVDPDFDLGYHLRRFKVPDGETWDDVLEECRRQSLEDFDRNRPLWKVTLLEGLPDGRAALITKLHHAIADGQGALAIGAALVDISPEGFDLGPMPDAPAPVDLTTRDFAQIMLEDNTSYLKHSLAKLAKGIGPAFAELLTSPQETVERLADTVESFVNYANAPSSPLSPIMRSRSNNYHFGTFRVPFDVLRDAAHKDNHTVNDVFLASMSRGMARYHESQGQPIKRLHINMPISTRKAAEAAQNAVSIARFDMPTDITDPKRLMDVLNRTVQRWRGEPVLHYVDQLGELSRFIPKEILLNAAKSSDLTVSNVPGPPVEIFLAGARVQALVPLPPPIGAAVFAALVTYNGTAYFGIALDDNAVDDRELMMQCIREGFEEITGAKISDDDPFSLVKPSKKKAPAKKAPVKKTAAKKAPAKKATAKKTPARKSTAKKAPAKKKVAKKKPATKKTPAKKTAKKAPAKKATRKK
ncbi:MAG: wax ester/triacylglycerol synthase domain-containing protein [Candidatus Nanopelagicales bacterium]